MAETPVGDTRDAKPKRFCGVKGRSGPPRKNRNSIRHGLKASQLPTGCKYIEVRLNSFRRQLEDGVLAAKGAVSMVDAACIQTCMRWERHAALAQRWLVKAGDSLKPVERLKFSEAIAKASSERDRALQALKIERDAKDSIIDALYTRNLTGPDEAKEGDDGLA
jgi:hypothetical protein